jgi:uncharacterized membrane protein
MFKTFAQRVFITLAALTLLNVTAPVAFDIADARTAQVVQDIENEALPAGASIEQVEQAVLSSLTTRGWQLATRAPGSVDAQYARRGFSATIRVTYSATAFSIHYVESSGLQYNPTTRNIHPNYNRWIANLRVDIPRLVQNSILGAPPVAR